MQDPAKCEASLRMALTKYIQVVQDNKDTITNFAFSLNKEPINTLAQSFHEAYDNLCSNSETIVGFSEYAMRTLDTSKFDGSNNSGQEPSNVGFPVFNCLSLSWEVVGIKTTVNAITEDQVVFDDKFKEKYVYDAFTQTLYERVEPYEVLTGIAVSDSVELLQENEKGTLVLKSGIHGYFYIHGKKELFWVTFKDNNSVPAKVYKLGKDGFWITNI